MANLPDYHWPPMGKRRVMGKPMNRLDGLAKSTGAAKYNSDIKPEGMLFGALLTSPHAHAKVKSVDISAAQKLDGVAAVRVVANPGAEVQWAGAEIAFVAARTASGGVGAGIENVMLCTSLTPGMPSPWPRGCRY